MSEIRNPDEFGGIDPDTGVSFIVAPARSGKGFQAVAVKIADPPKENKENENSFHESFDALKVEEVHENGDAAEGDSWGSSAADAWS